MAYPDIQLGGDGLHGCKIGGAVKKGRARSCQEVEEGGTPIKNEAKIVIQNIVGTANLDGKIDLEEAARRLPKSMYEPEQMTCDISSVNAHGGTNP